MSLKMELGRIKRYIQASDDQTPFNRGYEQINLYWMDDGFLGPGYKI